MEADIQNKEIFQSGFRLNKLEVFNWGTFSGNKVWHINPQGSNSLLTGDIGSGKSTLVDAITTLIVPHQKIIYNKAAGAESKERSVYSYIRGAYKNEKVESSSKGQDVFLRNEDTYSVILAQFHNEGFNENATLAQVFWLRNNKPEKFFVFATVTLSIKQDFSDFGSDIFKLKKRLKSNAATEVLDTFSEYANKFRQHFGIKQPEALDLFYQTVSMKSVGNLTDFVREQMLGKTDIRHKIEELVKRYEELTEAHNAVLKARQQQEMLEPLINKIKSYEEITEEINLLNLALSEIPIWFSLKKIDALKQNLRELGDLYSRNRNEIKGLEDEVERERNLLSNLKSLKDNSVPGRRLQIIETELASLNKEKVLKQESGEKYAALCKVLDFPSTIEESNFFSNIQKARDAQTLVFSRLSEISRERNDLNIKLHEESKKSKELSEEIDSLRKRRTQIPEKNLALRRLLMEHLNLKEDEIPFAGELIRVHEDEKEWEGAIERKLHDLGLSVIVPDRSYREFSSFVNKEHLNGKLVYLRAIEHVRRKEPEIKGKSLVNKVEIKSDSEFYDWLLSELEERHNYTCCESVEEFQREYYALTKQGQIKSGKVKHEKDDRRTVLDRRNYILGWSNTEKIATLEKDLSKSDQLIEKLKRTLSDLDFEEFGKDGKGGLSARKDWLRDLLNFTDFSSINFPKVISEIQKLLDEQKELETSSEELKNISKQIKELEQIIKDKEKTVKGLHSEKGKMEDKISQAVMLLKSNLNLMDPHQANTINLEEEIFPEPEGYIDRWISITVSQISFHDKTIDILSQIKDSRNLDELKKDEDIIIKKINGTDGLLVKKRNDSSRLEREIVLIMKGYRDTYPAETSEVDASLESIFEFKRIYNQIVEDDIKRHEERFKDLLKKGTINSILIFKNQLEAYEKEVFRKIQDINDHLKVIEYNDGTYIKIIEDKVLMNQGGSDIVQFKLDLKACLENIYGETDSYNEVKFLQVKKILDKFKCTSDEDKRWTERVTDVRQWYTFGASERRNEDDTEVEYYSDSSGKSGGQKEKLAYTILASSIAFQFGLEWGERRSRSFRFVVIDEAFGRGSDDSARYGLNLFKELNLQLLIVTPLQKINIIEEYINSVHFVSNPTGQSSMVRNISKEVYLKEKEEHFSKLEKTQ